MKMDLELKVLKTCCTGSERSKGLYAFPSIKEDECLIFAYPFPSSHGTYTASGIKYPFTWVCFGADGNMLKLALLDGSNVKSTVAAVAKLTSVVLEAHSSLYDKIRGKDVRMTFDADSAVLEVSR